MADLIVPTLAYGRFGMKYLRKKGYVKSAPAKFHLRKGNDAGIHVMKMACGLVMETQDELVETSAIRELRPDMLCKKCLGALKVK